MVLLLSAFLPVRHWKAYTEGAWPVRRICLPKAREPIRIRWPNKQGRIIQNKKTHSQAGFEARHHAQWSSPEGPPKGKF